TSRNPIQQVIELGGCPAEVLIARVAVSPHRVKSIYDPIEHHTRCTQHNEPKNSCEHSVTSVFQNGLNCGATNLSFIESSALPTHYFGNRMARLNKVSILQCCCNSQRVLTQTLRSDGEIQDQNVEGKRYGFDTLNHKGQHAQRYDSDQDGAYSIL